ncbi:MAG: hypothetical protein ACLU5I_08100 [Alistipes finegoldii]
MQQLINIADTGNIMPEDDVVRAETPLRRGDPLLRGVAAVRVRLKDSLSGCLFADAPESLSCSNAGLSVWSLFFLVWFCIGGHRGENKYGPDPKAE